MTKFKGEYPPDWHEIENRVKEREHWVCERCGHVHEPLAGYCLTVHHLDNDKSNVADWNLAALCQRCHLHIQGRVEMSQSWMFDHSPWMKPHLEGYLASLEDLDGRHAEKGR